MVFGVKIILGYDEQHTLVIACVRDVGGYVDLCTEMKTI